MTIFHPTLTTAFQTGSSKHPWNMLTMTLFASTKRLMDKTEKRENISSVEKVELV